MKEMKVLILHIGQVDAEISKSIRESLVKVFPRSSCHIAGEIFPIPKGTYNRTRNQYNSSMILSWLSGYATTLEADRVLGITDVDLYVPGMNFVFGEARYLGKTALISLHRLKPEFYGQTPNKGLLKERAVKEAVHELGHTLGLRHRQNHNCVMFFSLHIGMTDRKEHRFCERCRIEIEQAASTL